MKLSIVMPIFNERATLAEIVRRVVAVDLPKELILVDDCSTDGSREVIERVGREGLQVSRRSERSPQPDRGEGGAPARAQSGEGARR